MKTYVTDRIAHVYCIYMGSKIKVFFFLAAAICTLCDNALRVVWDGIVPRETGCVLTPLILQARMSLAVCFVFHITWIYSTLPHWSVLNVFTMLQHPALPLSFHCVLWETVNNTFIQFTVSVADTGAIVMFAWRYLCIRLNVFLSRRIRGIRVLLCLVLVITNCNCMVNDIVIIIGPPYYFNSENLWKQIRDFYQNLNWNDH
jgi:hypothetical protein